VRSGGVLGAVWEGGGAGLARVGAVSATSVALLVQARLFVGERELPVFSRNKEKALLLEPFPL